MANCVKLILSLLIFSHIFTICLLLCDANNDDRKVHIVYLGSNIQFQEDLVQSPSHISLLQRVVESFSAEDLFVRSYKRSFNGFAAKLTDVERRKLSSMKEVVSVFPSRTLHLHTTRSWDFMGFPQTIKRNLKTESEVIIGVIDTAIWPESESFRDVGFSPPPKKWKGVCEGGKSFTCNNKIIGARFYPKKTSPDMSARDEVGHGTHTASTAVGNEVKDMNFYGLAKGMGRGGVPSARIAAYKVCHPNSGCAEEDVLAAFDDAIADGVDLISISLGPDIAADFKDDAISIGSFHAMERGILTINSAGNSGDSRGSVVSLAPWILTVAASTIDRKIIDKVILGNGQTFVGHSVNSFDLNGRKFPLIDSKDASNKKCNLENASICAEGCLDGNLVKGKIVVCSSFIGAIEARNKNAVGSILENDLFENVSFVVPLPASGVSFIDYDVIYSYLNSTKEPLAEILKSEVVKDGGAPTVAGFSSRGPNLLVSEVLKPDVAAPGVDILAAYSPIASPSFSKLDKRSVKYNFESGTSMACPHVTAVAAYVKSFHPDWSASAIKSAISTTAWRMNATAPYLVGEFEHGFGHVNPSQALNPGLVYETFKDDYVRLLCSMGYNTKTVRLVSGDNSNCQGESGTKSSPTYLNQPSMVVKVNPLDPFTVDFPRRVTNVGFHNSTYKATLLPITTIGRTLLPVKNVSVTLTPKVLSFKSRGEKKSFKVTISGADLSDETYLSSSLLWSDGTHKIRSPILISVNAPLN